jgi:hypothetical protein
MFSTAYALHLKTVSPPKGTTTEDEKKLIQELVAVFVMLLIVDVVITMFAIYATIRVSEVNNWPAYVPILLVLIMIMFPAGGGILAISMIIYYFTTVCESQPKLAFSFY